MPSTPLAHRPRVQYDGDTAEAQLLNLGFTEVMLVLVVAIVVVGPERLPAMLGWLGRQYGKLMSASEELRQAFVIEAERVEADKRTEVLRQRRDEARKRIEAARARGAGNRPVAVPRPLEEPSPEAPEPAAPAGEATAPDSEETAPEGESFAPEESNT